MKGKSIRLIALVLCMVMCFGQIVSADSSREYISLGADLTSKEKATVLKLLDIEDISQYQIETITNAQEHEYLDEYLSKSVIGSRALSSVRITEGGDGINVTTYNISFCTEGMYRNALATAGMENATVTVAGPFQISGTAALVGAMKAYESMTGKAVSEERLDAANQELVVTGEVAEDVGNTKAEQMMALIKEKVVEGKLHSKEDIQKAIDESAEQLEVNLSEEDRQKIAELMDKITGLDLDITKLKDQAKDIYSQLEKLDLSAGAGFVEKIKAWFLSVFPFLR